MTNEVICEMLLETTKRLEEINVELQKTQMLIRDYNGLREVINECRSWQLSHDARLNGAHEKDNGNWSRLGYVVGAIGLIAAFFDVIVNALK